MNWFIFALIAVLLWGIALIFGKIGLVRTAKALTIRTSGVNILGGKVTALKAAVPKPGFF